MGLALLATGSAAVAHEVGTTKVVISIAGGRYAVDISTDAASLLARLDSSAAAAVSRSLDAAEYERRLGAMADDIRQQVDLRFDDAVASPAIDVEVSADEFGIAKARLHLRGTVPDAARAVSWRYRLTATTYELDVMSGGRVDTQWLEPEQPSTPALLARNSERASDAIRPLSVGFRRILPGGIEQILLMVVLGLGARRSMVREFLAFAVAELVAIALTFGLTSSASGLTAPSGMSALVALSVAFVAAESVAMPALEAGRLVRLFAAGVIHGVSLEPTLRGLGGAKAAASNLLVTVLPFAAGVQGGQVVVFFTALLLIGSSAGCESRRRQVAVPACIVIGITGFVWTLQRFL